MPTVIRARVGSISGICSVGSISIGTLGPIGIGSVGSIIWIGRIVAGIRVTRIAVVIGIGVGAIIATVIRCRCKRATD